MVSLSFSFLPRVLEEPHLFALLFSLGSVSAVIAFALRTGSAAFLQSRSTRAERPFTAFYIIAVLGTLHGAVTQSYLSTLFFAAAQFAVFMCRLEGLINLDNRRVSRSGGSAEPPSAGACGSCGRRQWDTRLETKSHRKAFAARFESLNYDEVSSDLERNNRAQEDGSHGYSVELRSMRLNILRFI